MKAKGTSFVAHFPGITERMFQISLESSLLPGQDPTLWVFERLLILGRDFAWAGQHAPLTLPLENAHITTGAKE